ncbi:MAG: hypothetical protein KJZ57_07260, partial [Anaerolineales bacterium]|nr:hypothetical protein [Anaerolineales bacterium]
MATYSRDDVIAIQESALQRGRDEAKEYIAKLETAVRASLAWLDNAPIEFGGEQELHDVLQAALAAQQSVQADECPQCHAINSFEYDEEYLSDVCVRCGI